MIYYGDIHGRFNWLQDEIQCSGTDNEPSVILGDIGIGFPIYHIDSMTGTRGEITSRSHFPKYIPNSVRFIRGNHDHPSMCNAHPACLGDYGYWEEHEIFYVGGGFSIDREFRTQGIDWWHDEELTYNELQNAITEYLKIKPKIIISHEGPSIAVTAMFPKIVHSGYYHPSRTELALQSMWEQHKPELWVFGHHHESRAYTMDTQFHCVGMLEKLVI